MLRPRLVAATLLATISLSACATIIHGPKQQVTISSNPTAAAVMVDGNPVGNTPVTTKLTRKDKHVVNITLDGYRPLEMRLSRDVDGWVWGNLLLGGFIGLAVDAITGSMYKIDPDDVTAQLQSNATGSTGKIDKDGIYVFVTMNPDASWTKIGQLERIGTSVATR